MKTLSLKIEQPEKELPTEAKQRIEDKIKGLSPEKLFIFRRILRENVYDRSWCKDYEVDYDAPLESDMLRAKEQTYQECFGYSP